MPKAVNSCREFPGMVGPCARVSINISTRMFEEHVLPFSEFGSKMLQAERKNSKI